MKIEPNAFPTSDQTALPTSPNRLTATLRWLLSFAFFLALFAVLITLIGYGLISFKGGKQTAAAPAQPASTAPTATPLVLPSGTSGHVAGDSNPATGTTKR